jgi:hypothetical protein
MDKKFLIGVTIFTIAVVWAGIFLSGGSSSKAALGKTSGAKAKTPDLSYSFGNIPLKGGLVKHAFPIKNTGTKVLTIANLATSCHCTKVYFEYKNQKSPKFGMKGYGSSDWIGKLKHSETGSIVAVFDPAYHGPQGAGPISRLVSAETNDPDHPYIEFSFSANVVK